MRRQFSSGSVYASCAFSACFSKRRILPFDSPSNTGAEAAVSAAFCQCLPGIKSLYGLCFPQFMRHNALCGNSTK